MPAAEETYRRQPALHAVFALTSIAMTLAIVWMIMADHLRPWKQVQREFFKIEDAKLKATEKEKLRDRTVKDQEAIKQIDAQIKAAEARRIDRSREIREVDRKISRLEGLFTKLDTDKRFLKAELDSQRSLYDGMIDLDDVKGALHYKNTTIVASEKRLLDLTKHYEEIDDQLRKAQAEKDDLLGHVDELKKERDRLTREVDRVKRALEQKEAQYFGFTAWLRSLPGVDLMPPTKIKQISLPELTINYNFKDVPRYDRCTTCHQGVDRLGYERDASGKPMPSVFASHPHVADGANSVDPTGKEVKVGLYLDGNGPHPINSFGCTICHGGQGSGTDFTYSSHEPNDLKQREEWESHHQWKEIHHWDEPMLPQRFIESSCVKCHHQVTDVPQATKLQKGYQRIVKYGCTGCHTIGGEGSFGPDLTEERQVGPNLAHIGSKADKDWTLKWIKNPHAFRPDTRMPRFYGVTNNNTRADWPKSHAEIHAITHYLYAKSTPPADFVDPPAKGDSARGKELFFQKGCMACHAHKVYDPSTFPESVRDHARADFGPNLSNVAVKFRSSAEGYRWLTNWIKAPESYHPKSLMPNVQVSLQDAADIASWILSVKGEWPQPVDVPAVGSAEVTKGLDDLTRLYVSKGGITLGGKHVAVPLSEVNEFVSQKLTTDEKLLFVGEKTISRLGCFGCHNIAGFETAKPIGTPLNGWGSKSPTKLDYGHIAEYLQDQDADDAGARDGTDPYYQEKLADHTRSGFLYQKLHRPRSYDYRKTSDDLKAWDDRLRMPQFTWANDPAAIEEVMTFVLGLTGEKIASRYLPKTYYTPRQTALAQGTKLLNRYNCKGCHVLHMPTYTIAAGSKLDDVLTEFEINVRAAYRAREADYLAEFYPPLTYDPKADPKHPPELKPDDGQSVTIEGMPTDLKEHDLTVHLWRPVTIRGFTFNVGDNVTVDERKVKKTDAVGGDFPFLHATYEAERRGVDVAPLWNKLPPPLIREGKKVQTSWLTAFLKDPYPIRPAVMLRMPRFHFGRSEDFGSQETAGLANFFAAHDKADFPYQAIPEREQGYLAQLEAKHPDYLGAGWQLMTRGACIQCHSIGQYKATGGDQVINGPDLRQVANRFRPGYLAEWLAYPRRLVPYTAMPQNVPPHGPPPPAAPKSFDNQPFALVKAMRDTLLNYVTAVEQQLAAGKTEPPKPAAAPAPKAAGASE